MRQRKEEKSDDVVIEIYCRCQSQKLRWEFRDWCSPELRSEGKRKINNKLSRSCAIRKFEKFMRLLRLRRRLVAREAAERQLHSPRTHLPSQGFFYSVLSSAFVTLLAGKIE